MTTQAKYPQIGLALGSGGAKGLAHIGVLKAFEKADLDIDFIAGTSIGALVGAFYAAHPDLTKLEDLILSFNKRKGYSLFDPTLRGGLLKGDKIEILIAEMLDQASFEHLRIPFAAIATDMKSAQEVILHDGDLVKAVRASISVPPIFQPVEYKGKLLADGGLSDPIPVRAVRAMGADIIIGVNVESGYFHDPIQEAPKLTKIPMHSVNILRHNITFQSLSTADYIISPKTPNIGLIGWDYFFNNQKALNMIKSGEEAAEKALPAINELILKKQKEKKKSTGYRRFFSFFKNKI